MSELANIIGQRIRSYRLSRKLSQEKLSELSGCHPTYIGQLERGEKNATIESISKIAIALGVSLSTLFKNIGNTPMHNDDIPLKCYEFLLSRKPSEQEQLYKILLEIDKYKHK